MKKKFTSTVLKAIAAVVLLFIGTSDIFAQKVDALSELNNEYPAVMRFYGPKLELQKAEYIIVMDVSTSMDAYREEVLPKMKSFLDNLSDGNAVTIVSFGETAREERTQTVINKNTRPALMKVMNHIYSDVMKDPQINKYTDFYQASNLVCRLVENDTTYNIHFVVFFTDLCEDNLVPGKHGNYSDAKWQALQERAAQLKDKNLKVFATYFPYQSGSPSDNPNTTFKQMFETGSVHMKTAFPDFSYKSDIEEVLGNILESKKKEIYLDLLKQMIPADMEEAIAKYKMTAELGIDKKVVLQANTKDLPDFFTGIQMDECRLVGSSRNIESVKFIQKAMVAFKKDKAKGKIGVVKFKDAKIFQKDNYVNINVDYHFCLQDSKSESQPSMRRDLEKLGLTAAVDQTSELKATAPFVIGWNFWLFLAIALFVCIYFICFIVNTLIPRKVKGQKLIAKNVYLDRDLNCTSIPDKRSFTLGNNTCDCKIDGVSFTLDARHRNGSPLNLLVKRRIVVSKNKNDKSVEIAQGKSTNLKKASLNRGTVITKDGLATELKLIKK